MKKSKIALLLMVMLVVAAMATPWNRLAEHAIKTLLAARGLSPLDFTVTHVGTTHSIFQHITWDENASLAVDELRVSYSPSVAWQRSGQWQAKGIRVLQDSSGLLPMQAHGDFSLRENPSVRIVRAVGAWGQGVVSVDNIVIPLSGNINVAATLQVKEVQLNALMQLLTNGRASASGVVSGRLPLRIVDGTVRINTGQIQAIGGGVLSIAPEAVPGGGQQMDLLRQMLSDFHYQEFALTMNSGKDDKLSILLSLRGNNPAVYNGRETKLNVRLTGDVISILQGMDINRLLKQDNE